MTWRKKIIIAVALLLITYLWLVSPVRTPAPAASLLPEWSPAEKQYVLQRMKFHGITGCIQDEKGYYFIRAGKRCRL